MTAVSIDSQIGSKLPTIIHDSGYAATPIPYRLLMELVKHGVARCALAIPGGPSWSPTGQIHCGKVLASQ